MARDPHKAVDFAPAWLNFNNSNKKKLERTSRTHSPSLAPTFSLSSPLRISQDPPLPFRTNSLGLHSGASPSRLSNSSFRNHHSPSSRTTTRHHSVDFSPSYLENKNGNSSPGRELKTHTRPLTFSPTLASSKSSSLTWTRNGPTPLHHSSGGGDTSPRLDTEFPSLSDADSSEQSKRKVSSGTVVNMWQKPLVLKNTEAQQVSDQTDAAKSSFTSSIYKTLVPKTSASHHKQPYRRTMSVPSALPSKNTNSPGEVLTNGNKRDVNRDSNANLHTTQKYLTGNTSGLRLAKSELQNSVNSPVVSGHKKHKKGKNHFLQTLRQTENEGESAGGVSFLRKVEESDPLPTPNDVDRSKLSDEINTDSEETSVEDTILSSSLEAEHRLLKEMGWKYSDDQAMEEEPPLTEDEIQEFRVRCNGVLPSVTVHHRDKMLENAFLGWKFSGIRKRSSDTDCDNNNVSTFSQKQENTLRTSEDLEEFSSDENDF